MGRHGFWIICVVLAVISVTSCTKSLPGPSTTEISASATAEGSASAVVVRKSFPEELAAVRALESEIEKIDATYPRPVLPGPDASLYRVTAVGPDGRIQLESGGTVRMEGIDCSQEGIGHISRLLLSEGSRVIYRRTTPSANSVASSDVWLVDVSGAGPPSYSLIAETALVSGWCVPEKASGGAMRERHRALAALAADSMAGTKSQGNK